MYCRQCHYDLRALTTNRCPECGIRFDPSDSSSFYSELPTVRGRILGILESGPSWRVWIVVFVCLNCLIVFLLPAMEVPRGGRPDRRELPTSQRNLTAIMAVWMRQQNESPLQQVTFDKQAAPPNLRPSLSAWTESNSVSRRLGVQRSIEAFVLPAIPFAIIFGTISLLWRGRVRKVAGALAILFVLACLSSSASGFLSRLIVPGTQVFLDDYVFVEGVDLRHATGKIAAYDWRGPAQGWHLIAFDDGRVEIMDLNKARVLFDQQGLTFSEPK